MTEIRHHQVPVQGGSIHVAETGDKRAPPLLFVHGWPETAASWAGVQALAAGEFRAIAIDLPAVGGSTGVPTDGSKDALADVVHAVVEALDLVGTVLVGHDVGGMIIYSYLRRYHDLRAAVIMDVVIPGVDPWVEVVRNPAIWHFGFHAVPGLPERLVAGHQRAYFDYFFDVMSAVPIADTARDEYAAAYATESALTAGFDWYRTLPLDAKRNAAAAPPAETPLLYLRGEHERGQMQTYLDGFRRAGIRTLNHGTVPGTGHFAPEESPDGSWRLIAEFLASQPQ